MFSSLIIEKRVEASGQIVNHLEPKSESVILKDTRHKGQKLVQPDTQYERLTFTNCPSLSNNIKFVIIITMRNEHRDCCWSLGRLKLYSLRPSVPLIYLHNFITLISLHNFVNARHAF